MDTISSNRKSSWSIGMGILVGIIAMFTVACTDSDPETNPRSDTPEVAILQYGSHPVIDEVVTGLNRRFEELFGPDGIQVRTYNANFDQNLVTQLSRQMLASEADVLVSVTTPATQGLIGVNRGQKPVVFTFVTNPADIGYEGPGTLETTTGLSDRVNYSGVLDLISTLQPEADTLGYLLTRGESNATLIYENFRRRAEQRGLVLETGTITQPSDVRAVAQSLAPKVDCFLFGGDNTVASNIETLINIATRESIPVYANDSRTISNGGLAGISVDYYEMGRRTAEYVSFVLAGASPEEIPVQSYVADVLALNREAFKRLGIDMPSRLAQRADTIFGE